MSWAEWRGYGFEAHGLNADPHFRDAAARDFRLKPGSPAIDAACGAGCGLAPPCDKDREGASRPQGRGWDQGALVYRPNTADGDIDKDGIIGLRDLRLLIDMILGVEPIGPAADLDGSGVVDVTDLQQLLNLIHNP